MVDPYPSIWVCTCVKGTKGTYPQWVYPWVHAYWYHSSTILILTTKAHAPCHPPCHCLITVIVTIMSTQGRVVVGLLHCHHIVPIPLLISLSSPLSPSPSCHRGSSHGHHIIVIMLTQGRVMVGLLHCHLVVPMPVPLLLVWLSSSHRCHCHVDVGWWWWGRHHLVVPVPLIILIPFALTVLVLIIAIMSLWQWPWPSVVIIMSMQGSMVVGLPHCCLVVPVLLLIWSLFPLVVLTLAIIVVISMWGGCGGLPLSHPCPCPHPCVDTGVVMVGSPSPHHACPLHHPCLPCPCHPCHHCVTMAVARGIMSSSSC